MSFLNHDVQQMNININKNVASRPRKQKKKTLRSIKNMVITFVVLTACIALFLLGCKLFEIFIERPDFAIKRVYVLNNRTISPNTIVKIAGVRSNMNIYATSLIPIEQRLKNHPDIKSVEITKRHPDMLVIKVNEREPIAIIISGKNLPNVPIDKEGVMLSENKMEYALHLPKITGLRNIVYTPGKAPDDPRVPVALEYLDAIKRVKGSTFLDTKKIILDKPNDIALQSATINTINFGTKFSPMKILKLVSVINELRFQRINADRIDLRFNNVAVTPRLL